MRIAVSYGSQDAASGGRLRESLARRLTRDSVASATAGASFDVVVALLSPATDLAPEGGEAGRVRRVLERAVEGGAGIVLVTLDGADAPAPSDLPAKLARLADLDPVAASNEYWDATVDSVVARIEQAAPARRRRGLLGRIADVVMRASRRVKIGAIVGVVAGVLGILATLGVIGPDPDQRATIEVSANAANALTYEEFLGRFEQTDEVPRPVPDDTQGYVYDLEVRLDDAESERYALRWTARVADGGTPIEGRRNLLAVRLAAERATGVHRVWVPCPPEADFDGVPYVVEFVLVDESQPSAPPLDRADGPPGECLFSGP